MEWPMPSLFVRRIISGCNCQMKTTALFSHSEINMSVVDAELLGSWGRFRDEWSNGERRDQRTRKTRHQCGASGLCSSPLPFLSPLVFLLFCTAVCLVSLIFAAMVTMSSLHEVHLQRGRGVIKFNKTAHQLFRHLLTGVLPAAAPGIAAFSATSALIQ